MSAGVGSGRLPGLGWLASGMVITMLAAACTASGLASGTSGTSGASGTSGTSVTSTAGSTSTAPTTSSTTSKASATSVTGVASTSASSALLARGQQRPATDIPWGQVGRNWFVALWSGQGSGNTGPVSLFLVNPVGGRYLVHTWSAPGSLWLDDWSGDGRRLLLGGTGMSVMDLRTGAIRAVTGFPDIMAAGFTAPSGTNLVLSVPSTENGREVDYLMRTDLTGGHAVPLGANVHQWLYAPDGRSVVLDGKGALPVVGNDGHQLRTIAMPSDQSCRPIRWWPDRRLLVSCGVFELWLISTSGGAPQRLTTTPPQSDAPTTFGSRNVFPLGRALYVQADGPCGYTYLARVTGDGLTTPVDVPGATARGLSQFVLGTDGGSRLGLLATTSCEVGRDSSVSWFDPTSRHLDILLGPGLNGGKVLAALEFPDSP